MKDKKPHPNQKEKKSITLQVEHTSSDDDEEIVMLCVFGVCLTI